MVGGGATGRSPSQAPPTTAVKAKDVGEEVREELVELLRGGGGGGGGGRL